ncbi:MAG: hypothetical protein WAN04_05270 [Candidatus Udaeobacter sp.]
MDQSKIRPGHCGDHVLHPSGDRMIVRKIVLGANPRLVMKKGN